MAKFKREDIENDERYSILENDTVYDNVLKKFAGSLEDGPTNKIATSEQGREMARLKHDQRNEKFAAGFIEGIGLSANALPEDAWKEAGKQTGKLVREAKTPRGFAELLNAAAKYMGYERPEHAQTPADVSTRALAELSVGLLDILKQVQRAPERDVVDAETTDG